jgi:ornithine--oxo-acid transaminase
MPAMPRSVAETLSAPGEAMALGDRFLNPQLGRIVRTLGFDREWVRGEGPYLIDADGRRYLDLLSGYGTFAIGRNHPDVVAELHGLLDSSSPNLPQLGVSVLPGALAQALVERAPARIEAMVTANSGTEAVEGAIKLARAATGRSRVLYAEHAFHGLTLGSLSLNGDENFREGFGPFVPGCERVRFGDLEALAAALAPGDVAAFIVEPIQGKGVNIPPEGYLAGAQAACRSHGTLFVCDEVQTGLGRTGRFFALEHWGLDPDMITVAKALSGGFVPVGGVLVSAAVRDAVFDGMERGVRHGSTFGGNDFAAAAGIATLRVIEREGLVERAAQLGSLLLELTRPLVERYEIVRDVRGMGLMWAIVLGAPEGGRRRAVWNAIERAQTGLAAQLIVIPLFARHQIFCQVAGHRMNVVKALPALVIEEEEIRRFAAALDDVVAQADRMGGAVTRLGWDLARGSARALRR